MATHQVVHVDYGFHGSDVYKATIDRGLSASGPWTPIGETFLTGNEGYFYDNTMPFDTPVWYRFHSFSITEVAGPDYVDGPFTLVSNGSVVLSDPLRPWADIEFGFCATPQNLAAAACSSNAPDFIWSRFGDRTSRADVGLFDILNAERPADVYARRKNHEGGIVFVTRTLAAIASVYDLFTAGGPLYLRAPAVYGDFDFTIQPGDLQRSYLTESVDQRHPFRLWTAPYTVVDLPLGPQQGIACATWCAVNDAFPTYADMTTAGGTWADLATGATVCP